MSHTQILRYTDNKPLYQALSALLIFVITAVAAREPLVLVAEAPLFYTVYGWSPLLYMPFAIITQLGSIYALGGLTVWYALKRRWHRMIRIVMTGTLAYTLSGVAKDLWGRARPDELFADVTGLDLMVRGSGFPSGHVAMATALALVVGHYLPKKYHWVVVAWIVGVALSRMYLGVHAPLDLLGGFAIGWLSYALLRQVRLSDEIPPDVKRRARKPTQRKKLTKTNK